MKPVFLYRIGSDPEWVFTKDVEWSPFIVPAAEVISNNKALATKTFVGTDNHNATAEVRPQPSHNIKRQLLDIATGLVAVRKYMDESSKFQNLRIMAWPYVLNEPLGGHIHVSFLIDEPLVAWAHERNITYGSNLIPLTSVGQQHPPPGGMAYPKSEQEREMLEQFAIMASKWEIPTPWIFGKTLNYLCQPFERWVQPWPARVQRNSKYGNNLNDLVRIGVSSKPKIDKFQSYSYCHYEYRMPSTWLQHPYLAYAYYALAKFTMLNFDMLSQITKKNGADVTDQGMGEPKNSKYKALFEKRWGYVNSLPRKITNDIKDLPMVLEEIEKNRLTWFDPSGGVNVNYWRDLL